MVVETVQMVAMHKQVQLIQAVGVVAHHKLLMLLVMVALCGQAAALLPNPEIDSLLVLGMGAGAAGRYLRQARPDLRADYVDIDPAIPEVAERFFFFEPGPLARQN